MAAFVCDKRGGRVMKICLVSSSGGHWEELMCVKALADENSVFYVTEVGGQADSSNLDHLYQLPQINRHEKGFLWHFIQLFCSAGKILSNEKPDMVITTGALLAFPFCLLAKLRGAKIVYIESFARVHSKSLTGRLVYPFADLFLVQWEPMLKLYPKAKYIGGIF